MCPPRGREPCADEQISRAHCTRRAAALCLPTGLCCCRRRLDQPDERYDGADDIDDGTDPKPFALTSFKSTMPRSDSWHRIGRNFAYAYIRTYRRRLQAGLCVLCLLALSSASVALFPAIPALWTIPGLPESKRSSPPCRPQTPWCDGEEPMCLRPHSAGSTILRLWPTDSSLGMCSR
jgi:hypothetical protein